MTIAIVTGASSGLGREYAKLLDEENVGEIWLISRHERTLQKTAEQLKTKSRILPLDLTQPSSYSRFADVLREHHPVVSYFIHAAGFGRMGSTTAMSERDTAGMIAIHCHAAVFLTTAVLPYCQRGSHIVEICSCAAFQPLPYLAVYACLQGISPALQPRIGRRIEAGGNFCLCRLPILGQGYGVYCDRQEDRSGEPVSSLYICRERGTYCPPLFPADPPGPCGHYP